MRKAMMIYVLFGIYLSKTNGYWKHSIDLSTVVSTNN